MDACQGVVQLLDRLHGPLAPLEFVGAVGGVRGAVACSPKTGPGIMRVQQSLEGEGGLSISRRRKRHTPEQIIWKVPPEPTATLRSEHGASCPEMGKAGVS